MSLLVIYLMIGAFISLLFWQAYSLFHYVPVEDRQFLDRPALGFRMAWPLIQAFVHYGGKYISPTREQIISLRLRHAGVEYSVSAKQFVAAKFISAIGFALVALFLTASMGRSANIDSSGCRFSRLFLPGVVASGSHRKKARRDFTFTAILSGYRNTVGGSWK